MQFFVLLTFHLNTLAETEWSWAFKPRHLSSGGQWRQAKISNRYMLQSNVDYILQDEWKHWQIEEDRQLYLGQNNRRGHFRQSQTRNPHFNWLKSGHQDTGEGKDHWCSWCLTSVSRDSHPKIDTPSKHHTTLRSKKTFIQIIETSKHLFLVMEYVEQGELFDYIVKKGKLEEQEACRFFKYIISGIHYIHELSIVHRDLKP